MPESVEGNLTNSYVAVNTFIHRRDIAKKIFDRYREDTLFDFLFHTGRRKFVTDNTQFNHHEFGFLYGSAIVETNVAGGGAGASTVITIEEASHQDSGTKSSGKVGDSVIVNGIHGWVSATDKDTDDAHTYTIQPVNPLSDFGATDALIGDIMSFYSNAHSDGSNQPASMVRRPTRFYNYVQIFKHHYEAYGSESANKAEVEIDGKPYYYLQGEVDANTKHKTDMDFAFLLNDIGDTLTDPNNDDEPLFHSRGMESYIDNFGNTETYTTFDFTDLENIEKTLSAERAPMKYMWINGVNLDLAVNLALKGLMQDTGIDYSAFGKGNAEQRSVDFGFNAFRYANRSFFKRQVDYLNYGPITGFAGSPYPDMGFVVPLDTVKDAKTGKDMATISLRFKENDRENRFIKHWTRGIEITNKDRYENDYRSEAGLHMAGVNQCIKVAK